VLEGRHAGLRRLGVLVMVPDRLQQFGHVVVVQLVVRVATGPTDQ
jgi:hypothetical protein